MSKFIRALTSAHKREEGITGLETAIILIAFVIVASVFAFVVLSTGLFSAERGKEAVFAGLEKARGNVEVRGAVTGSDSGVADGTVDTFVFNLGLAAAGSPQLIDPTADLNTLAINYIDSDERVPAVTWTATWIAADGGAATPTNDLLEPGELVEITVALTGQVTTEPVENVTATLEVVPPSGGTLLITRTMPPEILTVMDLH
jgi:flagellin FlaB